MKQRLRFLLFPPFVFFSLVLSSCGMGNYFGPGSSAVSGTPVSNQNTWTILVSMNADNDLSGSAFADLNAMEAVDLAGTGIAVVALMDLGAGGNVITGAWPDARMYRVVYDAAGAASSAIVSQRLGWGALGLTTSGLDEDVDMGDPGVLASFIAYAKTNYPARRYALILWGHATDWRTAGTDASSGSDPLYVKELGQAVNGKSLDVIGFDAPSEAMLEVAYEIRAAGRYMISSEGTSPVTGWDLKSFLAGFAATGLSALDFVDSAIYAFSAAQAAAPGACISAIDLTMLTPVVNALNDFSSSLSSSITTSLIQSNVRQTIFGGVESYYTSPGDKDVDIVDMANVLKTAYGYAGIQADALTTAVQSAVIAEWHHPSGHPRSHGLALHYVPVLSDGTAGPLDPSYFRDTADPNKLSFLDASSWVPASASGPGLEYRIWLQTITP